MQPASPNAKSNPAAGIDKYGIRDFGALVIEIFIIGNLIGSNRQVAFALVTALKSEWRFIRKLRISRLHEVFAFWLNCFPDLIDV